MLVNSLIVTVLVSAFLERVSSVQFSITKELKNTKALEKNIWSNVEFVDDGNDNIKVNFEIPIQLNYADVFIFFANDKKEILRVSLKETIKGTFYEVPHKVVKELEGDSPNMTDSEKYHLISGKIPVKWLPESSNKTSATVIDSDGKIYNYYGIQNYDISIPDLMVLEEYKSYNNNKTF